MAADRNTNKTDSRAYQYSQMTKVKAILAALLGSMIEWYDNSLYGYMGVVIMDRFFPHAATHLSFINHYLVFALGFIARPLGAYIFGCIGDGFGRRSALRWNILGVALPTVLIGFLPSYEEIGVIAIIILCICRFSQGIFAAAEADGVDTFLYETMPKSLACVANSFNLMAINFGFALAAYLSGFALQAHMPPEAWRVPFIVAGAFGVVALWFRKDLVESQDYMLYLAHGNFSQHLTDSHKEGLGKSSFSSFFAVIKKNLRPFFVSILLEGSIGATFWFYLLFFPNYLHSCLNLLSASKAAFIASLLNITITALASIVGYVADKIGIKTSVKLGHLFSLGALAINGFYLHTYGYVPISLMVLTTIAILYCSLPTLIATTNQFRVSERYRCMSMSRNLGAVIFSSSVAVISTQLWKWSGNPLAPLYYCAGLLVMGFIASFFIVEQQTEAYVHSIQLSKGRVLRFSKPKSSSRGVEAI